MSNYVQTTDGVVGPQRSWKACSQLVSGHVKSWLSSPASEMWALSPVLQGPSFSATHPLALGPPGLSKVPQNCILGQRDCRWKI